MTRTKTPQLLTIPQGETEILKCWIFFVSENNKIGGLTLIMTPERGKGLQNLNFEL